MLPSGRSALQIKSSATSHKIEKAIQDAAVQYQLSPKLIKGVIKAESNYDANAISPAGAQGLMQLMPGTARDMGVSNPFDIKQNIDGGVRYLRKMMDMFGGNVRKALSAYNAGPETVKRYNGDVPYSETRQYVDRVIDNTKTAV
ncbi:MAG: lytic transglycosylase domain-containing protein [Deltaproteobacteria bacterium]|nr:lytic transglycosylase domain-containing protein [Deltaproteobacteria bacterium]